MKIVSIKINDEWYNCKKWAEFKTYVIELICKGEKITEDNVNTFIKPYRDLEMFQFGEVSEWKYIPKLNISLKYTNGITSLQIILYQCLMNNIKLELVICCKKTNRKITFYVHKNQPETKKNKSIKKVENVLKIESDVETKKSVKNTCMSSKYTTKSKSNAKYMSDTDLDSD